MYVAKGIVSWKNTGLMPTFGDDKPGSDCDVWLSVWKDFVNGLIAHEGFGHLKVSIDYGSETWKECLISRRIFPGIYILKPPGGMEQYWEVIRRAKEKEVLLSVFVVKKSPDEYGKLLCYDSIDPNPETEVPIWIATSDWEDLGF